MKKLLLIDGNAIMHRAYHAIPPFKTKDGVPTNIVYGFFSMLYKATSDFQPTHIAVCFDTPVPTFRKELFKEYQAHRPKADEEFKVQVPNLKEALDTAGILRFEKDGYEADDVIGTIAKNCESEFDSGIKVMILTGDKDMLQLVNDHVFVIAPQTGLSNIAVLGKDEVKKKFDLPPSQVPDLKALSGDPSDNYSGAKGIGPKTAVELIKKFGSVENIYKNIEKIESEKTKQILIDYKDNVLLGKRLAQISTDVSINFDLQKAVFEGFKPALKDYLLKYDIKSLTARIFGLPKPKAKETTKKTKEDKSQIKLF